MEAKFNPMASDRVLRLVVAAGTTLAIHAIALGGPEGGRVVHGQAAIDQAGPVTTIRAGDGSILTFDRFDIAAHETVRFLQPSSQSRVLNRITGSDPSIISGSLLANGQVYIVNPAGIYFTGSAVVDVGALYAAAGNMTNEDFLAGINNFSLSGTVSNDGVIHGSAIHLFGQSVANHGTIIADDGIVALRAGDEVLMGAPRTRIYAKHSVGPNNRAAGSIEQAGTIEAERVSIGAGDLFSVAMRSTSSVRARQVEVRAGLASTVRVAGQVDVSSSEPGATGGTVSIIGQRVHVDNAVLDASGHAGGGTIEVGGGYRGAGEYRAQRVAIGPDAILHADATVRGDGGQVIVWADSTTTYDGLATARGKGSGGNGGLVETSGKIRLRAAGHVDASAPEGRGGVWLLDPLDVIISNATTDPPVGGVFSPGASGATVAANDIRDVLAGGTSVVVTTNVAGPETGNITWLAGNPLSVNLGGGQSLTLDANGSIDLQSNITATGAALDLVLEAGTGTSPDSVGSVTLADGIVIDLNGGTMQASGAGSFTADQTHSITASSIDLAFGVSATLSNTVATTLGPTSTGGGLAVDAPSISSSNAIVVGGTAEFEATTAGGDVNLSDLSVTGSLDVSTTGAGGNATLVSSGAIGLGTLGISGALDVTAASISGSDPITVGGAATFDATGAGGDIDLTGLNVTGTITASTTGAGGDATLVSSGAITLGTLGIGGSLDVTATSIGGSDPVTVGGTAVLDATAAGGDVNLSNLAVAGTISVSTLGAGGDATLVSSGAIELGTLGIGGALDVTATAITGSDPVVVGGAADLNATSVGGDIDLSDLDVGGATDVSTFGTGGNATLASSNAIELGAVAVGGTLDVTAPSVTVTQASTAGVRFAVNGASTLEADVLVGAAGIEVTGDTVVDGSITVSASDGDIDFGGAIDGLTAATDDLELDAGTGAITLGGPVGNSTRLGTFTITDAGDVDAGVVRASRFDQLAGSGTTTIGTLDVSSAFGASLTGSVFNLGQIDAASGSVAIVSTGATTIAGNVTLDGGLDIDSGGDTELSGTTISAASATFDGSGDVRIGSDITVDGALTANVPAVLTQPTALESTGGAISFNDSLQTSTNNLVLTTNSLVFAGGAGSVTGTSQVTFRPTAGGDSIGIGAAGDLALSSGTLSALSDGFSRLIFGRGGGSHAISVGAVTFTDPVLFRAPSGTTTITSGLTMTGLAGVEIAGDAVVESAAGIVTDGGSIVTDRVRLADGLAVTFDSGGGDIQFDGELVGTAGGATEAVAFDTGSGDVLIGGAVSDIDDLSIVSANDASFQAVTVTGDLGTTAPLTGALGFAGAVSASRVDVSAATASFASGLSAVNDVNIESSVGTTFSGSLTAGDSVAVTGTFDLDGDVQSVGGDVVLGALTRLASDTDVDALSGLVQAGTIQTNGNTLLLRAEEIDLVGGASSVSGGGTVVFEPATAGSAIRIGSAAIAASGLDLSQTDLDALASDIGLATIGRAAGSHSVLLGSTTFRTATTLRAPSGSVDVDGPIDSNGNAFTINGPLFLGAVIETGGGDLLLTGGSVTLDADVLLDSSDGAVGGDITVTGAVDSDAPGSPRNLDIRAGDGDIALAGVGVANELASLAAMTSGQIAFGELALQGDLDIDAAGTAFQSDVRVGGSADIGSDATIAGLFDAGSSLDITGDVTLTADAVLRSVTADVRIQGSVEGDSSATPRQLTVEAANGDVDLDGSVGVSGGVNDIDIDAGGTLTAGPIRARGDLAVDANMVEVLGGVEAEGAIRLDGLLRLGGSVNADDEVELVGPVTLVADASVSGDGVRIDGTIDGANALVVDARGGAADFVSPIGGTVALADLDVDAASVSINNTQIDAGLDIDASGSVSMSGTTWQAASIEVAASEVVLSGTAGRLFATTGGILSLPTVQMGNASSLDVASSGGDIAVADVSSSGAAPVSIDAGSGTILLGGSDGLGGLSIVADDLDLGGEIAAASVEVRTSDAATPIVLGGSGAGTGLVLSAAEVDRFADGIGSIVVGRSDSTGGLSVLDATFRDPVILEAGTGVARVQGTITGVGDANLTVRGAGIELGGVVSTQGGSILFDGPLMLLADSSATTGGGDWTVVGGIGGDFGLSANLGAGTLDIEGDVAIASIDAASQSFLLGNSTTTSGSQRFNGALALAADTLLESGANIEFGTVDGSHALVIRAGGEFVAGDIGSTTPLDSLEIQAASAQLGLVRSTGDILAAADDITLQGNVASLGTGSITLGGDVGLARFVVIRTSPTTGGSVVINGRVDGPGGLRLSAPNSSITLADAIGSVQPLDTIEATAESIVVSDVTTTGSQLYDGSTRASGRFSGSELVWEGPIELAGDLQLSAPGSGDVRLLSNVDGPFAMSVDADGGQVELAGTIGQNSPLTAIELAGIEASIGNISTSGALEFESPTRLAGVLDAGGPVLFLGTLSLAGDSTIVSQSSGGIGVEARGGIEGARQLSIRASDSEVRIAGGVGEDSEPTLLRIEQAAATSLEGLVRSGAILVLDGGSIDVSGTLGASGQDGIRLVGDTIAIDAIIESPSGTVRVENTGTLQLGPNLDIEGVASFVQNGSGSVLLNTDLSSPSGTISLSGPVILPMDRVIAAAEIELAGAIDSSGTARSLSLVSQGDVSLTGDIGLESPLSTLETDAGGTTRLGASVVVLGPVTFGDSVVLVGDSSILAGQSIRFEDSINGVEGMPAGLVLTTDTSSDGSDGNPIPLVVFGGDVGGQSPIGSLSINADGRPAVPVVPTIERDAVVVGGAVQPGTGDLRIISIGDITFGANEKLSVLGDVELVSGGVITLGDISALGEIGVAAPTIRLLARPAGVVLNRFEFLDEDDGLDFVTGDGFAFSTVPVVVGDGSAPSFASPSGGDDRTGNIRSFQQRLFGEVAIEDLESGSRRFDLRSLGPSNTNVAEALAGATPRVAGGETVQRGAFVDAAQREKLQRLGVFAREAPTSTRLQALLGRALYEDYGSFLQVGEFTQAEVNQVTVDRLSGDRVQRALDAYEGFFSADSDGESTASRLKDLISAKAEAFIVEQDTAGELGEPFALYINEQNAEVLQELRTLRDVLVRLGALGLSPKEREDARDVILGQVRPEFMTVSDFEKLLASLDRSDSTEQEPTP